MAADAALRIGEQVVSVLSSAGFHKFPYPSIQPSEIMLVPGQTAEGSWPLVKVTNFGLPALIANPEPQLPDSNTSEQPTSAEQGLGNQQFSRPTRDIGSEIYSLGVTLYFLLTGAAISAEALQQGARLSGFPKPLRALLGRIMNHDPDQRPKDLLVVTGMIRGCLEKIERRRELSERYGIPFRTSIRRRPEVRPRRLVRIAVTICALLVLAAAISPLVFPESVKKILRGSQISKPVGVLIGVPDSSPAAVGQAPQSASAAAPSAVGPQPVNPVIAPEPPVITTAAMSPKLSDIRPADVQQAEIANAQSQAAASTDSAANSAGATPDSSDSADTDAKSAAQANAQPSPTASQLTSHTKKKSVASNSRGAPQRRSGSVRSRVIGITSDGRLIFRLPSGRTAIVAPDEEEFAPRHRSRAYIDRDQTYGPPPGFGSDYFPDD